MSDLGIFEGYMETQYREGQACRLRKGALSENPYAAGSDSSNAWVDGFNLVDEDFFPTLDNQF